MLRVLGSETRLKILKLLAHKPETSSSLSRRLRKSLPTVTRHLAYLEESGLVKRVGTERGKTRPHVKYALKESVIIIKAIEGDVDIVSLPLSEGIRTQVRIWSIPQQNFHYYIERFLWQIQDHMPYVDAIGVYGSVAMGEARKDSDVDVLILASNKIAELKKECEAMVVERPGEEAKMVMAQVFRPEDFEKALRSGSDFAREVTEGILPIYDPKRVLSRLMIYEKERAG